MEENWDCTIRNNWCAVLKWKEWWKNSRAEAVIMAGELMNVKISFCICAAWIALWVRTDIMIAHGNGCAIGSPNGWLMAYTDGSTTPDRWNCFTLWSSCRLSMKAFDLPSLPCNLGESFRERFKIASTNTIAKRSHMYIWSWLFFLWIFKNK